MSEGNRKFFCSVCCLPYDTMSQFEEHKWSVLHHTKLENQKLVQFHVCSLCKVKTSSLTEYSKHLINSVHVDAVYKRQQWLRRQNTPKRRPPEEDFSRDSFEGSWNSPSSGSDSHQEQSSGYRGYNEERKRKFQSHHKPRFPSGPYSNQWRHTLGVFDLEREMYNKHQKKPRPDQHGAKERYHHYKSKDRGNLGIHTNYFAYLQNMHNKMPLPESNQSSNEQGRLWNSSSKGGTFSHALQNKTKKSASASQPNLADCSFGRTIPSDSKSKKQCVSKSLSKGHNGKKSENEPAKENKEHKRCSVNSSANSSTKSSQSSSRSSILREDSKCSESIPSRIPVLTPVLSRNVGIEDSLTVVEKSLESGSPTVIGNMNVATNVALSLLQAEPVLTSNNQALASTDLLGTEVGLTTTTPSQVKIAISKASHGQSICIGNPIPVLQCASLLNAAVPSNSALLDIPSPLEGTPSTNVQTMKPNSLPEVIQRDIRKLVRNRLSKPNLKSSRVIYHPDTHSDLAVLDLKNVLLDLFERPVPLHRKALLESQLKKLFINAGKDSERFHRFGIQFQQSAGSERDDMIEMLEKLTEEDLEVLYKNESHDILHEILSLFQTPEDQSSIGANMEGTSHNSGLAVADKFITRQVMTEKHQNDKSDPHVTNDAVEMEAGESDSSDVEIVENEPVSEIVVSSDDGWETSSTASKEDVEAVPKGNRDENGSLPQQDKRDSLPQESCSGVTSSPPQSNQEMLPQGKNCSIPQTDTELPQQTPLRGQVFKLSMAETKVREEIKEIKKKQTRVKKKIEAEKKKLGLLENKLERKRQKLKELRRDRRELTRQHLKETSMKDSPCLASSKHGLSTGAETEESTDSSVSGTSHEQSNIKDVLTLTSILTGVPVAPSTSHATTLPNHSSIEQQGQPNAYVITSSPALTLDCLHPAELKQLPASNNTGMVPVSNTGSILTIFNTSNIPNQAKSQAKNSTSDKPSLNVGKRRPTKLRKLLPKPHTGIKTLRHSTSSCGMPSVLPGQETALNDQLTQSHVSLANATGLSSAASRPLLQQPSEQSATPVAMTISENTPSQVVLSSVGASSSRKLPAIQTSMMNEGSTENAVSQNVSSGVILSTVHSTLLEQKTNIQPTSLMNPTRSEDTHLKNVLSVVGPNSHESVPGISNPLIQQQQQIMQPTPLLTLGNLQPPPVLQIGNTGATLTGLPVIGQASCITTPAVQQSTTQPITLKISTLPSMPSQNVLPSVNANMQQQVLSAGSIMSGTINLTNALGPQLVLPLSQLPTIKQMFDSTGKCDSADSSAIQGNRNPENSFSTTTPIISQYGIPPSAVGISIEKLSDEDVVKMRKPAKLSSIEEKYTSERKKPTQSAEEKKRLSKEEKKKRKKKKRKKEAKRVSKQREESQQPSKPHENATLHGSHLGSTTVKSTVAGNPKHGELFFGNIKPMEVPVTSVSVISGIQQGQPQPNTLDLQSKTCNDPVPPFADLSEMSHETIEMPAGQSASEVNLTNRRTSMSGSVANSTPVVQPKIAASPIGCRNETPPEATLARSFPDAVLSDMNNPQKQTKADSGGNTSLLPRPCDVPPSVDSREKATSPKVGEISLGTPVPYPVGISRVQSVALLHQKSLDVQQPVVSKTDTNCTSSNLALQTEGYVHVPECLPKVVPSNSPVSRQKLVIKEEIWEGRQLATGNGRMGEDDDSVSAAKEVSLGKLSGLVGQDTGQENEQENEPVDKCDTNKNTAVKQELLVQDQESSAEASTQDDVLNSNGHGWTPQGDLSSSEQSDAWENKSNADETSTVSEGEKLQGQREVFKPYPALVDGVSTNSEGETIDPGTSERTLDMFMFNLEEDRKNAVGGGWITEGEETDCIEKLSDPVEGIDISMTREGIIVKPELQDDALSTEEEQTHKASESSTRGNYSTGVISNEDVVHSGVTSQIEKSTGLVVTRNNASVDIHQEIRCSALEPDNGHLTQQHPTAGNVVTNEGSVQGGCNSLLQDENLHVISNISGHAAASAAAADDDDDDEECYNDDDDPDDDDLGDDDGDESNMDSDDDGMSSLETGLAEIDSQEGTPSCNISSADIFADLEDEASGIVEGTSGPENDDNSLSVPRQVNRTYNKDSAQRICKTLVVRLKDIGPQLKEHSVLLGDAHLDICVPTTKKSAHGSSPPTTRSKAQTGQDFRSRHAPKRKYPPEISVLSPPGKKKKAANGEDRDKLGPAPSIKDKVAKKTASRQSKDSGSYQQKEINPLVKSRSKGSENKSYSRSTDAPIPQDSKGINKLGLGELRGVKMKKKKYAKIWKKALKLDLAPPYMKIVSKGERANVSEFRMLKKEVDRLIMLQNILPVTECDEDEPKRDVVSEFDADKPANTLTQAQRKSRIKRKKERKQIVIISKYLNFRAMYEEMLNIKTKKDFQRAVCMTRRDGQSNGQNPGLPREAMEAATAAKEHVTNMASSLDYVLSVVERERPHTKAVGELSGDNVPSKNVAERVLSSQPFKWMGPFLEKRKEPDITELNFAKEEKSLLAASLSFKDCRLLVAVSEELFASVKRMAASAVKNAIGAEKRLWSKLEEMLSALSGSEQTWKPLLATQKRKMPKFKNWSERKIVRVRLAKAESIGLAPRLLNFIAKGCTASCRERRAIEEEYYRWKVQKCKQQIPKGSADSTDAAKNLLEDYTLAEETEETVLTEGVNGESVLSLEETSNSKRESCRLSEVDASCSPSVEGRATSLRGEVDMNQPFAEVEISPSVVAEGEKLPPGLDGRDVARSWASIEESNTGGFTSEVGDLGKAIFGLQVWKRKLYSYSKDGFARCSRLKDLSCERVFAGHQKKITGMCLYHKRSENVTYLFTSSRDHYLMWHILRSENTQARYKVFDQAITCMTGYGDFLYISLANGSLERFHVPSLQCSNYFRCQKDIRCMTFIAVAGKEVFLTGSADGALAMYKSDGTLQGTLEGHLSSVLCVKGCGRFLLSGDSDGKLLQHDFWTKRLVFHYDHQGAVTCIKLYKSFAYTASLDNHIRIIDYKRRQVRHRIMVQDVLSLFIFQDQIYIGKTDGTLTQRPTPVKSGGGRDGAKKS